VENNAGVGALRIKL